MSLLKFVIVLSLMHIHSCLYLVLLDYSEFSIQGMTWLLPERFSESEIGPEAGLLKLWQHWLLLVT